MPGRDDGLGVSDHASKVMTMRDAVAGLVHDGDTVVIEGFTHLICFAAGHEIIRQRRRDLTLARLTPDLIYDQMIGAGCGTPDSKSRNTHISGWSRALPRAPRGSPSGHCATTRAPTCRGSTRASTA